MVYISQNTELSKLDYLYPSRPLWDRGRKVLLTQFVPSEGEDCVVFLNEIRSMFNTYIYRSRALFLEQRQELVDAMSKVKVWNDIGIPRGAYTVPVSVTHHMGSLRMYIRANRDHIRLSYDHCQQLLWMFDKAMEQLEEWDTKMEQEFGETYVRMP